MYDKGSCSQERMDRGTESRFYLVREILLLYLSCLIRIVASLQNQGSDPRPWKLHQNTTGGVDEERKVSFVYNLTFLSMGITREVLITTRGPATAVERKLVSICIVFLHLFVMRATSPRCIACCIAVLCVLREGCSRMSKLTIGPCAATAP